MHFLCKCNRNPRFMPFALSPAKIRGARTRQGSRRCPAKDGRLRRAFRLSFGRDFLGYFSVFCRLRQGWRVRGALRSAGGWRLRGGAGLCWRVAAEGVSFSLHRAGWRLRGGAKFRWRVAAEGASFALRRAGWRLRGGAKFRWRVAAEGVSFALRRAGGWLRGGAKFRWRVAAEGGGCALRRAGCCVGAGPAGRCGRFSCFAHAPLIKKSGQKRNHGLLRPAFPSGWSA